MEKTLPIEEWTHEAHLTVGLWFVVQYGPYQASKQIPECIYQYNESKGIQNTDSAGYHQTITQFWIWLLNEYWEKVRNKVNFFSACNHLFTTSLVDKSIFLNFYSRDVMFSTQARKLGVTPDKRPLNFDVLWGKSVPE